MATLHSRLGSERHPRHADTLRQLALVLQKRGEQAQARTYLERVLTICTERRGRAHPQVADTLSKLTTLAQTEDEIERAYGYAERPCP